MLGNFDIYLPKMLFMVQGAFNPVTASPDIFYFYSIVFFAHFEKPFLKC